MRWVPWTVSTTRRGSGDAREEADMKAEEHQDTPYDHPIHLHNQWDDHANMHGAIIEKGLYQIVAVPQIVDIAERA